MVLTKRERYIGIATVAVLSILVLDQFILSPAKARIEELDARIELAEVERLKAQQLKNASARASRDWKTIAGDAMTRDTGDPESRVLTSVREWAQEEGMRLPSVIPQPAQVEKGFNKIVFRATGSGNLSQVGRFLYRVQTASMPLRITDLQITSKDGTDELSVNFGIATISPIPETNRPGGGGGGAAPTDRGAPRESQS
jgi:type II secretory pathway component PulM